MEKRIQLIDKLQIEDEQFGVRPGCGTMVQLFTLARIQEGGGVPAIFNSTLLIHSKPKVK